MSNPFRSGGDIRGAATVRCIAPVLAIDAEVALFQEGIPFAVAHDYDLQLNTATVTGGWSPGTARCRAICRFQSFSSPSPAAGAAIDQVRPSSGDPAGFPP